MVRLAYLGGVLANMCIDRNANSLGKQEGLSGIYSDGTCVKCKWSHSLYWLVTCSPLISFYNFLAIYSDNKLKKSYLEWEGISRTVPSEVVDCRLIGLRTRYPILIMSERDLGVSSGYASGLLNQLLWICRHLLLYLMMYLCFSHNFHLDHFSCT